MSALIKGTIVAGDSVTFAQLVQKSHPFLGTVYLWSSGGSVEEAMKIGRLIRKGLIATSAPIHLPDWPVGHGFLNLYGKNPICNNATCHCASACFLIWAGGVDRQGNLLGLHRPSSGSTSFGSLPPDRVGALYREILSDIAKYLTEMEIPPRFVEIMTDTSSRDIRWLTDDETNSLTAPPSIAEWTASTCGSFTKSEEYAAGTIGGKVIRKNASPREKELFDRLLKKKYDIYSCGVDKVDKARQAIKEIGD